jgi:hypothetical protein
MRFWSWLAALAAVPLVSTASGVVLNHQGRLFDAADRPVDGTLDFTFALHADETATRPLWQATYDGVTVSGGIYSVVLGEGGTPLDAETLSSAQWLSVSVGGGELLPRLRLGAVPFAADAASLGGRAAADYLTKDDAANFLTAGASTLLATKQEVNACLLKAEAATTYLTKAEANAFLDNTVLADFARLSDLAAYAKTDDLSAYAKTADVSANYYSRESGVPDVRNILENGGFEAWMGLFQTLGFNGTTAQTYLTHLPIGWTGVVAGNTSTPQGVDPSAAVSSYLTTGRVVSRQTGDPKEGSAYVRLTFPAVTRDAGVELKVPQLSLEPNRTYTLAFWLRVQVGTNPQNDVVATAAGTQFVVGGASAPLPTSWTRMGPFPFTTGASVSGASLVIRPRGLGGTVDIDGVGLWRGTTAGDHADAQRVCPGDMVGAGDFCIEPAITQLNVVNWQTANETCRVVGRRLCRTDELTFAGRRGVISAGGGNNLWGWVGDGSGDSGYCRVNLGSPNWFGRVYCDGGWPTIADAGRICCASR